MGKQPVGMGNLFQGFAKMSHECPDCGELCFCGSDIDDCMNNLEKDVMNCTHECAPESEDDDCFEHTNDWNHPVLPVSEPGVQG